MSVKSGPSAGVMSGQSVGTTVRRLLVSAVLSCVVAASAQAQDQGVPFKMQPVGDQVVNGVLVKGARVPVWTDNTGRPAGRAAAPTPDRVNQEELNELARIGRPDQRIADARPIAPPAQDYSQATQRPGRQTASAGYAQEAYAQAAPAVAAPAPNAAPPATIRRKARSDDEEVMELERAVTQAESDLKRKKTQIEERKKDEARKAEEARVAAEREAARKLQVFQAMKGQTLSEAISAYVGQNGWENLEWNISTDYQVKYNYSERPSGNEGMKEVLLRVLKPYGLSAELHRPNSVVEVYPAGETNTRN